MHIIIIMYCYFICVVVCVPDQNNNSNTNYNTNSIVSKEQYSKANFYLGSCFSIAF